MYHELKARVKAIFRWLAFQTGTEYKAYDELSDVPGYDGWYEWRGRCVAFKMDDGTVQFVW